ncbi:MAG TPA: hypothetical protein PK990_08020 [Salinivirgaceae bacterium]|nr:hypothetical protein [Salinivirgaceae bacterium]
MEQIFDIVRWILPSFMVFIAMWLVMAKFQIIERQKQLHEQQKKDSQTLLPIRLRAHERMLLFLERIDPEAMVMRMQRPNITVQEFHSQMLREIRQEWNHNVTQQLYLSDKTWIIIKNAKENVVKIINTEAGKLKPGDPSIKLSQVLLENFSRNDSPTKEAIDALKNDIRQLF